MNAPAGSNPANAAFLVELTLLRTSAGLSPAQLADRLGVEEHVITRGEAGTRQVGVVELQRWTFACGSTLEDFGRRLDERIRQ